jgi:hypothetical protein
MAKITFFSLGNGGGGGGVDSVTAVSPITSTGGTNPVISSLMNTQRLIGRSSSGSGVMEQIEIGDGLDLVGGVLSNTATPTPLGYYGGWQDNQTQSANANNVGVAMIFREVDLENGVSVVSNGTNLTRITFAHTGVYNLQFSSQFQNIDNAQHDVSIWLRKNEVDVDGSSGFVSVPVRINPSNVGHTIVSWNYLLEVVGGDYYELIWSTTNYQNVTMEYYSAGNPPPATASVILTVTQQSGIMAGTGITALNGLTDDVQTFATGTTGTDFNISSSGSTHTFNIPSASNLARGLVSIIAQTFAGIKTFLSAPIFDSLTASRILATDGSKAVQSLDTATYPDLTELSYIKGTTSAIQTQLNSKQATITGGATTIVSSDLTASRVLVSDTNGKVATNNVTTTELGYLTGVTSAIQTQLNSKQASLPYTPVYVYAKNSTTYSSSGTGSQILTSLTIPANTFVAGDVLRITGRFKKVGTNSTSASTIYINNAVSLSGGKVVRSNPFAATTLANGQQGSVVIINATNLSQIPFTVSSATDIQLSTGAWVDSTAIDWTTTQYILFSCAPNNAGDVVSLIYYQIEKL